MTIKIKKAREIMKKNAKNKIRGVQI